MTDTAGPTGDGDAITTRDWIKGLVVVAIVFGVIFVLLYFAIGGFCGCGTRPVS